VSVDTGVTHGEGCESDAGIDAWAWNYYSWAVEKTRLVIESYCPCGDRGIMDVRLISPRKVWL